MEEKKNEITLTPQAAEALKDLLEQQEQEDASLRIFISGVG